MIAVGSARYNNRHFNDVFICQIQDQLSGLEPIQLGHINIHENHWVPVKSTVTHFIVRSFSLLNHVNALVAVKRKI